MVKKMVRLYEIGIYWTCSDLKINQAVSAYSLYNFRFFQKSISKPTFAFAIICLLCALSPTDNKNVATRYSGRELYSENNFEVILIGKDNITNTNIMKILQRIQLISIFNCLASTKK